MEVMPIIAFIGVRISWLMFERKMLLAADASRALSRFCLSFFVWHEKYTIRAGNANNTTTDSIAAITVKFIIYHPIGFIISHDESNVKYFKYMVFKSHGHEIYVFFAHMGLFFPGNNGIIFAMKISFS